MSMSVCVCVSDKLSNKNISCQALNTLLCTALCIYYLMIIYFMDGNLHKVYTVELTCYETYPWSIKENFEDENFIDSKQNP